MKNRVEPKVAHGWAWRVGNVFYASALREDFSDRPQDEVEAIALLSRARYRALLAAERENGLERFVTPSRARVVSRVLTRGLCCYVEAESCDGRRCGYVALCRELARIARKPAPKRRGKGEKW